MGLKDTFFCKNFTLNCQGRLLQFNGPAVMGIINITPDSFYAESRAKKGESVLEICRRHLDEGAAIIDIGACSTRPGAKQISELEENERLFPALDLIVKNFPEAIVSVDTYRAGIAQKAVDHGAHIINDISGGTLDPEMFRTLGKLNVPYVLMHIKGSPENMQDKAEYKDLMGEIIHYLAEKLEILKQEGVNDIIIDPGFGFGKTLENNYELLNKLGLLNIFEKPILAGMSRKGMVQKLLNVNSNNALNGTTVVNTLAALNGADILRVHDVREAVEVVRILEKNANPGGFPG